MDAPHEAVEAAAPSASVAETVAEPQAAEDSVEQDVSLPGAAETSAESTASEPTYTAAAELPDAEEAAASAETAATDPVGEAPQHLELAADQAAATANPDEPDAAAETPSEARDEVAASNDQPVDNSRSEDRHPEGTTAENMELAADQAEATVNPDQYEAPAEAETPSAAMDETAASNDRPAGDSRSEDQGLDEHVTRGSLELAADQADAASMPEVIPETESASEPLPQNLELASDEAEAQSPAAMNGADEPEELVEADRAEAALNEGEREEDIEDLAALDGASAADFDASAEPSDPETSVESMKQQAVELTGDQQTPPETATLSAPALTEAGDDASALDDTAESAAQEVTDSEGAAVGASSLEDAVEATTAEATVTAPEAKPEALIDETAVAATETSSEPAGQTTAEKEAGTTNEALSQDLAESPADENVAETVAEAQPEGPADDTPAIPDAAPQPAFQFRRNSRPVRFVWKLDAQGRFSEVSEEFARTVGPHAGNINGMSYRDLDSLFNLDPDKEIASLLERRDTWSGRTIRWPVEGTDLVVPVDLAALPTYSRNREFDGFRGFGIIRVADAEQDPHAVGLSLGLPKADEERQPGEAEATANEEQSQPAAEEAASVEAQADDVPLTVDGQFEGVHADEASDEPVAVFSEPETILISDLPEEPEDEFRGEVPALKLESNPLASFSDKVVQLEERRARGREGLTPNEQNAFREIARQLEPFGKRPNEVLFNLQKDAAQNEQATVPEEQAAETASDNAQEATTSDISVDNTAEEAPQLAEDAEIAPRHEDAIVDSAAEPSTEAFLPAHEAAANEETSDDVGLTASAADQIPLAILIHAGDRLIYANSEFKRFSGYDSLEALETAGGLDALIARREGPDAGVYAIRADGTEVPVSARLQSVRYEGAKLLMLALAQAERQQKAEDNLADDHEAARKLSALKVEVDELHSILETATDGVVVLDTDGRIRSMNRSASALFNFEDNETRGKPFAMLFAHESQRAVQDYLNGLIGHGVASVLNDGREVIGREASGGFIPLFMTMGRMPGSNSYCAVIRDITQWKRSEEELRAAKRAAETANQHKSDFLARVSHEIRTPLNAIIGFSDMIASEHFGPAGHPRYVEYANDIARSGRHVLDIVNDLLDISKIEAGEMDLEFAAVGINDCVSEAVSLVQPQANTQRVIIRTSLSQSVPDVVADVRSIKQIAINILANAIRFTPSGGQIVVSTAYEPTGSVALRIRDTGVGMSKGELEQAMKPFGQVSPGARKRGDGTGLGLPLTKAMTEANRALFSIQSSPNEGTLVEIVFPPQRVLAD
jgi:PAS domain S-box-containing protein